MDAESTMRARYDALRAGDLQPPCFAREENFRRVLGMHVFTSGGMQ